MATLFAPLKILIVYVNLPTPKPHYSHVKMSWYLVQSWIQCNFRLFWPKFRYHGNSLSSLEDSDIIFWFVDPENLLFTRKMSRYLVQKRNQCNFGLFLPKFGCHGNSLCSLGLGSWLNTTTVQTWHTCEQSPITPQCATTVLNCHIQGATKIILQAPFLAMTADNGLSSNWTSFCWRLLQLITIHWCK